MTLGRDAVPASVADTAMSPGGTRVASPGHYRPRPGPTAVKGESLDAAVARRLARRIFREVRQVR